MLPTRYALLALVVGAATHSGCATHAPARDARGRAPPAQRAKISTDIEPTSPSRWLIYGTRPWNAPWSHFTDRLLRVGEHGVLAEVPLPGQIAWSPGGELLRVCDAPDLGRGLSLIRVTGATLTSPRYVGGGCGGWWAPRGGRAVTPDGAEWVLAEFLGAGSTRRLRPPLEFAGDPIWSPTGPYLWTRSVWGARPNAHWLTVTADSASLEPLRAGEWEAWPSCSWSPDGGRLACRGHRGGDAGDEQGLLVFQGDASTRTPIGQLLAKLDPLPGGRFVSGLHPPLWVGADWLVIGTVAHNLRQPGRDVRLPESVAASPRHSVVAYSREGTLRLTNLETGAERTFLDRQLGKAPTITWAPDGDHLLVHTGDRERSTIWLLPFASSLAGTPRRLATALSTDSVLQAAFTPGSSWVWLERGVRVPAGCDEAASLPPADPRCQRDPKACGAVPCEMDWVKVTAHHVGSGRETDLAAQHGTNPWTPDDRFLVEGVSTPGLPSSLQIRFARGAVLDPIARIEQRDQVRFSWQP